MRKSRGAPLEGWLITGSKAWGGYRATRASGQAGRRMRGAGSFPLRAVLPKRTVLVVLMMLTVTLPVGFTPTWAGEGDFRAATPITQGLPTRTATGPGWKAPIRVAAYAQARARVPAPPLNGGVDWLNTARPIRLQDLRGKVVLLDFWTYCCINCMHMMPVLRQIEEKYRNELVVIGVHSGKFQTEKDSENIRNAVLKYDLRHPVVNDANLVLWRNYRVESWPSFRLIDPEGFLVAAGSGEVSFEDLDAAIAGVVREHLRRGTLNRSPVKFALEREGEASTPLRFPGKVLADAAESKLYIADSGHNRIVIASFDGEVLDVVGSGGQGARDGSYPEAQFNDPQGMALGEQTLYVADTGNHMIREIDLRAKSVGTLAGTGRQAPIGSRGGRSVRAELASPWDLALVEGRLFIAMAGLHQIWLLDLQRQTVRPYIGSGREDVHDGSLASAALAQPSAISADGERLYFVDSEGNAVRMVSLKGRGGVSTVVGPSDLPQGKSLFAFGDRDGEGSQVRLQHPVGLTAHEGTIYVADTYNHKIKIVDPDKRVCSTWLGDGQPGAEDDPPRFYEPGGLSAAGARLFVADTNNHLIRVVDLKSKKVQTLDLSGLEPPNSVASLP